MRLPSSSNDDVQTSPEELRKIAEEKEAKRLAAEEKKNVPTEKVNGWLNKFAADQAACLTLVAKSVTAIEGMKDALRLEYHKS